VAAEPVWSSTFLSVKFARFGQRWAWWLGLGVSLVTGLGVLLLVLEGAPIIGSLLWVIVPVVLVGSLLSPVGRQEFRR
jgi:hypothetical protein